MKTANITRVHGVTWRSKTVNKQLLASLVLILSAVLGFGTDALAQSTNDCATLHRNSGYNAKYIELKHAFEAERYDEALALGQEMLLICDSSPIINYVLGEVRRRLGDETKALFYFQKASNNMTQFEVAPDMAQLIWYARYEAEHPMAAHAATWSLDLQKSKEQILALKQKRAQDSAAHDSATARHRDTYWKVLWIGVGFGVAGLLSTAGGGAMVGSTDFQYTFGARDEPYFKIEEHPRREAGWAMIGVGLGLTALGSIMAGLGAYYYRRLEINDASSLELSLSASSVQLKAHF